MVEISNWLAQPKVGLAFLCALLIGLWIGIDVISTGGPLLIAVVWSMFVPAILLTVAVGSLQFKPLETALSQNVPSYKAQWSTVALEFPDRPPCLFAIPRH